MFVSAVLQVSPRIRQSLVWCLPRLRSTRIFNVWVMASRKGFRIQRYAWSDGHTLVRQFTAPLPNFTHYFTSVQRATCV